MCGSKWDHMDPLCSTEHKTWVLMKTNEGKVVPVLNLSIIA